MLVQGNVVEFAADLTGAFVELFQLLTQAQSQIFGLPDHLGGVQGADGVGSDPVLNHVNIIIASTPHY